jgi:hypothetical protein
VFFSDDPLYNEGRNGDWKVICSTDIRGHRGDASSTRPNIGILNTGRDSDYWGLRVLDPEVLGGA